MHAQTALVVVDAAALNAVLRPCGWALMEVTINMVTGFARIIAERREGDSGVKVTLLRSGYNSKVVERRDVIARVPGMYRDFWEVTDASFGGRRFDGLRPALRGLANYIDDNATGERLALAALRPLAAVLAEASPC